MEQGMAGVRFSVWVTALMLAGCSDSGPDEPDDQVLGRWLVETVNGQSLPATGPVIGGPFGDTVVSGRLTVTAVSSGFPRWEYCTSDAQDGHLSLRGEDEVRYHNLNATTAELTFIRPLNAPVDTIRVSGDQLTWDYNLSSDPPSTTDVVRFRRLADGEGDGPVCAL
jgi:hypothetical protein